MKIKFLLILVLILDFAKAENQLGLTYGQTSRVIAATGTVWTASTTFSNGAITPFLAMTTNANWGRQYLRTASASSSATVNTFVSLTVSNLMLVNPLPVTSLSSSGAPAGTYLIAGPGGTVTYGNGSTNLAPIGQWIIDSYTNNGISYFELTNPVADYDLRLGGDGSIAFGTDPNNLNTQASYYSMALPTGVATNISFATQGGTAGSQTGYDVALGGRATGGASLATPGAAALGINSVAIGVAAVSTGNNATTITGGTALVTNAVTSGLMLASSGGNYYLAPFQAYQTNATIHAGISGFAVMSFVHGTNWTVMDIGGGIFQTNHIP
jgi:hypothetical protein